VVKNLKKSLLFGAAFGGDVDLSKGGEGGSHKYIKRIPKPGGGYDYIYSRSQHREARKQNLNLRRYSDNLTPSEFHQREAEMERLHTKVSKRNAAVAKRTGETDRAAGHVADAKRSARIADAHHDMWRIHATLENKGEASSDLGRTRVVPHASGKGYAVEHTKGSHETTRRKVLDGEPMSMEAARNKAADILAPHGQEETVSDAKEIKKIPKPGGGYTYIYDEDVDKTRHGQVIVHKNGRKGKELHDGRAAAHEDMARRESEESEYHMDRARTQRNEKHPQADIERSKAAVKHSDAMAAHHREVAAVHREESAKVGKEEKKPKTPQLAPPLPPEAYKPAPKDKEGKPEAKPTPEKPMKLQRTKTKQLPLSFGKSFFSDILEGRNALSKSHKKPGDVVRCGKSGREGAVVRVNDGGYVVKWIDDKGGTGFIADGDVREKGAKKSFTFSAIFHK